jgi:DNA (cytosine-5)-methyltransferase 1
MTTMLRKSASTFIDLFSGTGGWSYGLELAGLTHLASIDIDPVACATAAANVSGQVYCSNVTEPPAKFLELKPDIVVGSPPCQGFSTQGRKVENDPRNSLVWSYLDLLDHFQPKVWVFENVPGFARLYGGRYLKDVLERLKSTDYRVTSAILNAADFGVPQNRKRFFMVGTRVAAEPSLPSPTHGGEATLFEVRSQPVTIWDAIGDLPVVGIGERVGEFDYESDPVTDYQRWARSASGVVRQHTTQRHSDRVLEKIQKVGHGENMGVFVDEFAENAVDYMGGYRRAAPDKPSYTAYWTRGMTSIHPYQDRFLSPRECARIQSFPDDFQFLGRSIENYRLVCNAVPPLLARAWGESLLEHLSTRPSSVRAVR